MKQKEKSSSNLSRFLKTLGCFAHTQKSCDLCIIKQCLLGKGLNALILNNCIRHAKQRGAIVHPMLLNAMSKLHLLIVY
ncbi:hypothetical protein [Human papillomavirus type 41]|uniref:Probable protein E5 n=1 Tax=Human papillomavirus type 41 TaxID=10589 RepID=VE5_HPV41|nr:hypothetical protein [Human papillomavirus type 41]P27554.1 RecName: Full=Probable protein E5 [Human papillomavirus type 41]CAA39617.1 ORF E5 [Human papillomavirus type 41]